MNNVFQVVSASRFLRGLLVVLISVILLTVFVFLTYKDGSGSTKTAEQKVPQPNNQFIGDYFKGFSSEEKLLYSTNDGLFQFDRATQDSVRLTDVPATDGHYTGRYILSPDNTKVAYYNGPEEHTLWLLDLESRKTMKLDENVRLYEGYTQDPVWSADSQSLFVTNDQPPVAYLNKTFNSPYNILYRIDLNGDKKPVIENQNFDVFWPRVLDNDFIAFNPSLPDGQTIGLLNIRNGHVSIIGTESSPDLAKVGKLANGAFLMIGHNNFSNRGSFEKKTVFGVETFGSTSSETEKYALPDNIKITSRFKRVEPLLYCGHEVILSQVDSNVNNPDFDEKSDLLYLFNLENQTAKNFKIPQDSYVFCDHATDSETIYTRDLSHLHIDSLSLDNPADKRTLDYSSLLPDDIQKEIRKGCLYTSFEFVTFGLNDADLAYIDIGFDPGYPSSSKRTAVCQVSQPYRGIYRASLKEKSFFKVLGEEALGKLIIPNNPPGA